MTHSKQATTRESWLRKIISSTHWEQIATDPASVFASFSAFTKDSSEEVMRDLTKAKKMAQAMFAGQNCVRPDDLSGKLVEILEKISTTTVEKAIAAFHIIADHIRSGGTDFDSLRFLSINNTPPEEMRKYIAKNLAPP